MFWKYFLFEAKLLLHNRKNWLLGIALVLYFPVFIYYTNQAPNESLRDVKRAEQEQLQSILEMYGSELYEGTPEQQEVYQNLIRQASLVNFQVFYIREGEVAENYIDNGLELTAYRLQLRDLKTQGIADHLILSEEETLREDALLQYLKEEQIELDSNLFFSENQFVLAFGGLSGFIFLLYLLFSANDIVVYELRHESVLRGMPISFMKKMNVKIILRALQTILFLILGVLSGILTIVKLFGGKVLNNPILIYWNGQYEVMPLQHYIFLATMMMVCILFVLYYLSILLNLLFKNAYANIVIGISLFLIPEVMLLLFNSVSFMMPLKFIHFTDVLSGDMAKQLGNSNIDFVYASSWLIVIGMLCVGLLYMRNKLSFRKVEVNLEK